MHVCSATYFILSHVHIFFLVRLTWFTDANGIHVKTWNTAQASVNTAQMGQSPSVYMCITMPKRPCWPAGHLRLASDDTNCINNSHGI